VFHGQSYGIVFVDENCIEEDEMVKKLVVKVGVSGIKHVLSCTGWPREKGGSSSGEDTVQGEVRMVRLGKGDGWHHI